METEKKRKYDVPTNNLSEDHGCPTKIIHYMMTWGGIITNYHKCIQKDQHNRLCQLHLSIVLNKTQESISRDCHGGERSNGGAQGTVSKLYTRREPAEVFKQYPVILKIA